MLVTFTRTVVLYIVVVIIMRLMGKRQIGELQPFEFVVTLMLSELAALPMEDIRKPLFGGIIPILTLLLLQITISFINVKSEKARCIICGRPSIVIENGQILEKELSKLKYGINDLLEQLRSKDCPDIADVEYAILETNGELSIILKSSKKPIIREDLNIPSKLEGLPTTLIIDAKIIQNNLVKINRTVEWLESELKKLGINDYRKVFFCGLNSNGKLTIQLKDDKVKS